MLAFADKVRDWMEADPQNIIAIHCKGGKGRTGTMICVWLIEAGLFESAKVWAVFLACCYVFYFFFPILFIM
jgi:protein-tyrosine phosphatase